MYILLVLCRYNTFCGYPPEIVKKMPKKDLTEEVIIIFIAYVFVVRVMSCTFECLFSPLPPWSEIINHSTVKFFCHCQNNVILICVLLSSYKYQVWRLQAALGEQTEITKYSQQEYERLQNVMYLILNQFYLVLWLWCKLLDLTA